MSEILCYENHHMNGYEYAIWSLGRRLAHKTGTLCYSGRSLARHFRQMDKDTVYAAIGSLVEKGWFRLISPAKMNQLSGKRTPAVYRVLSHDEWLVDFPGCCPRLTEANETLDETLNETEDENGPDAERIITTLPKKDVGVEGRSGRSQGTILSVSGDDSVGVGGHEVEAKQKGNREVVEPAAALLLRQEHAKTQSGIAVGNTGQPSEGDGLVGKPSVAPSNFEAVSALLESRFKVKQRTENIEPESVARLNALSMTEWPAALTWALEEPFWCGRILGRGALASFIRNLPTIQHQMIADRKSAERNTKSKGGAFIKAASVRPHAKFHYKGDIL
jgi:hypothetical protein